MLGLIASLGKPSHLAAAAVQVQTYCTSVCTLLVLSCASKCRMQVWLGVASCDLGQQSCGDRCGWVISKHLARLHRQCRWFRQAAMTSDSCIALQCFGSLLV